MDDNNSLSVNGEIPDYGSAPEPTEQSKLNKLRKVPIYKNKKVDLLVLAAVLFLIAGGLAIASRYVGGGSEGWFSPLSDGLGSNPIAVKDVQNPITGDLYTTSEAQSWSQNRPLCVMINNHVDARPQSGLVYADQVYEIVAEGGITRFLSCYLTNLPEKVGPIRSTREYYLVLVKELGDAMLMHEGYSPQALLAIESWPVRSLQRGGASFINWRDNPRNVAVEHTLYSNAQELHKYGVDDLGWEGKRDFETYTFKDDTPASVSGGTEVCLTGECKPIVIDFWYQGDYSAIWQYDKETNTYLRFTGYDTAGNPIPHIDQETGEQVRVKNLIIQFAVEQPIVGDDKSRLEYDLIGSGQGLVFIDGGVANVTWTKEERDERTMFYDENGEPFAFNRGKFWLSLVPERNIDQVYY